jgi:RHS repeat-associated protein
MKRLILFAVLPLLLTLTVRSQDLHGPGMRTTPNPGPPAPVSQKQTTARLRRRPFEAAVVQSFGYSCSTVILSNTPVISEQITPEIVALAANLQNNPAHIYDYVRNNISYVHYFGSKKGSLLTLLEGSGNDFDQCALLVALLRAASTNAGSAFPNGTATYAFGMMDIPYQATGTNADLAHWLGFNAPLLQPYNHTNYTAVFDLVENFAYQSGYPQYDPTNNIYVEPVNDYESFAFHRVWVQFNDGTNTYCLDPAFKPMTNFPAMNIASAMGCNATNFLSDISSGATITTNYTQNLNWTNLAGDLTTCTSNLLWDLNHVHTNFTVQQVMSGGAVIPSFTPPLTSANNPGLPFQVLNSSFTNAYTNNPIVSIPVQYWTNIPATYLSMITNSVDTLNLVQYLPALQSRKLSMTFSNSQAVISLDDIPAAIGTGGGGSTATMTTSIHHPTGSRNYSTHTVVYDGRADQNDGGRTYLRTAPGYVVVYGFDDPNQWLVRRQQRLAALLAAGYTNQSPQVVTETLNIIGLNWIQQTHLVGQALAEPQGVRWKYYHRGGRAGQESGYYVDLPLNVTAAAQTTIDPLADNSPFQNQFFASSLFWSAMEDGTIEQMTTNVAASTTKMLYLGNASGQKLIIGSLTNASAVVGLLAAETHLPYSSGQQSTLYNLYSASGNVVFLPSGTNVVGTWDGYGYLLCANNGIASDINGGYGGFGGYKGPIDPVFANNSYVNSVGAYNPGPATQAATTVGDPVNMLDGSFAVNAADLAVGQAEPRGLLLTRHYDTNRREANAANMGNGWTHRYAMRAFQRSDPAAALGHNTAQEMAAMLAATTVATAIMNTPNSVSNPPVLQWSAVALIAEWAVDQLTNNAVSITMGPSDIQFIKQPDGSFTPPAGVTMTLTQPSGYALEQRRGNTFNFDAGTFLLDSIVDQVGQTMSFSYTTINATNTVLSGVSDCWSSPRSLTFNYNTANPPQLTSMADSTGRSVSYGYGSNGDLVTATDANGKVWTYEYDADHKMLATLDPLSHVVVTNTVYITNNFNGFPSVAQQLSQGLASNVWKLYVAGKVGVQIDPQGGATTYFYDVKNRLAGVQDADGNQSSIAYDGQDHVIQTVTPLGETNLYFFDGSNNMVQAVDPLGLTSSFFWDSVDNLVQTVDPRGNTNKYGYSGAFELTSSTDGAGDAVTYSYNSGGSLLHRIDPGGTTSYGSDSYGQLSEILYPSSLCSVYFTNNVLGDVIRKLDGRGFLTQYQYDGRRALTNVIGPTNLTASLGYDSVGNLQTRTDPRGFVTTNVWSPTRRLLAVVLPSTPQGVPAVTNLYDARDWLAGVLNPLQQAAFFTNDPAHRLTSVTDPLGRTTQNAFDGDGHLLTSTDPASETTSMAWTTRGQVLQVTDPAGNITGKSYDPAGNMVTLTNRDSNVWTFQFDAANHLTNTVTPTGRKTAQRWNSRGLPSSIVQPSGHTTTISYDAMDRLSSRADPVGTTTLQYDVNNNVTNVLENSVNLESTFDAYNRVVKYVDGSGNIFQYQYDGNSNLTNLVYPGGNNVFYLYDSLSRLTNVVDWAGRKTSYAYDLASHLTSVTRPNGTVRQINYDAAGQTTSILEETSAGGGIAYFQFTNDLSGRIQSEFIAPIPHPYSLPSRTMTYDADDRLATIGGTSVTMDADGNMTYGPGTNSTFGTYAYDARNRLSSGGGLSYGYDALRNRTWMTNGATVTQFIVNPNALMSQTLIRVEGGVTNYYVYGLGLIYHVDTAGNSYTYHYDSRGSTVAITSSSGTVTDRVEYSPYGAITYRSGTTDTPFLFNGRQGVMTDANGLLFMRARYYNPYLCRFINADPSGFGGGLNFFAFASGNPVSLLDPFGLGAVGEGPPPSWLSNQNSVPNVQYTVYPNVNSEPQMGAPGFVAPQPYYDPTLPTTYSATYPNDQMGSDVAKIASVGLGAVFAFGVSGVVSEAVIGRVLESVAAAAEGGEANLLYHYTTAPESSFANGLWEGTSVTDKLYTDAAQASQELGIPVPNQVIPIQNTGQFVPNTPAIVQPSPLRGWSGGGNDFINPQRVQPSQLLPAQPIGPH